MSLLRVSPAELCFKCTNSERLRERERNMCDFVSRQSVCTALDHAQNMEEREREREQSFFFFFFFFVSRGGGAERDGERRFVYVCMCVRGVESEKKKLERKRASERE